MRRGIIVLLTLLMLAQSTWAAMAVCCLDEAMNTSSALEQLHAQEQAIADADSSDSASSALELKHLCEVGHCHCHHACAAVGAELDLGLGTGQRTPPLANLPDPGKSHIPDGLERPNWQRA